MLSNKPGFFFFKEGGRGRANTCPLGYIRNPANHYQHTHCASCTTISRLMWSHGTNILHLALINSHKRATGATSDALISQRYYWSYDYHAESW